MAEKEGFEEENIRILVLFSCKNVMLCSEIIIFCTGQSSCFIRNHPIKGQNKGQTEIKLMTLPNAYTPNTRRPDVQVKEFYDGTIYL